MVILRKEIIQKYYLWRNGKSKIAFIKQAPELKKISNSWMSILLAHYIKYNDNISEMTTFDIWIYILIKNEPSSKWILTNVFIDSLGIICLAMIEITIKY